MSSDIITISSDDSSVTSSVADEQFVSIDDNYRNYNLREYEINPDGIVRYSISKKIILPVGGLVKLKNSKTRGMMKVRVYELKFSVFRKKLEIDECVRRTGNLLSCYKYPNSFGGVKVKMFDANHEYSKTFNSYSEMKNYLGYESSVRVEKLNRTRWTKIDGYLWKVC